MILFLPRLILSSTDKQALGNNEYIVYYVIVCYYIATYLASSITQLTDDNQSVLAMLDIRAGHASLLGQECWHLQTADMHVQN